MNSSRIKTQQVKLEVSMKDDMPESLLRINTAKTEEVDYVCDSSHDGNSLQNGDITMTGVKEEPCEWFGQEGLGARGEMEEKPNVDHLCQSEMNSTEGMVSDSNAAHLATQGVRVKKEEEVVMVKEEQATPDTQASSQDVMSQNAVDASHWEDEGLLDDPPPSSLLNLAQESPVKDDSIDGSQKYAEILYLLKTGTLHPANSGRRQYGRRCSIRRAAKNFVFQDHRLYYEQGGRRRLVITGRKERDRLLAECHENPATGGHFGSKMTTEKAVALYFWDHLRLDTQRWVEECPQCCCRGNSETQAPPCQPVKVSRPWRILGVESMGPLPASAKGCTFLLIMTDPFTKFVIAKPLYANTVVAVSEKIVDALFAHGLVEHVVMSQGRDFVNRMNEDIFSTFGVKYPIVLAASRQQMTGEHEMTSQLVKTVLAKHCRENPDHWDVYLPTIVSAINFTEDRSTKVSPHYAMFGRHPLNPGTLGDGAGGVGEGEGTVEDSTDPLEQQAADIAVLHAKIFGAVRQIF